MIDRQKISFWIFVIVAVLTTGAVAASMAHMVVVLGWANNGLMQWVLAVTIVTMSGCFVALAVIAKDVQIRRFVYAGLIITLIIEFIGNFAAGGLLAMQHLPKELETLFFGIEHMTAVRLASLLFAGSFPIMNFISITALSESALRLLEQGCVPNEFAHRVMQQHTPPSDSYRSANGSDARNGHRPVEHEAAERER